MITLHVVPNAHIDPAWLWDWREGMNESLATCYSMVKLMEKHPDLTFTRGESLVYGHIEKQDPELFKRIIALYKEGRWEIAGAAVLQPDTNQGCGEAYVRQYLYGREYFKSRFGAFPEIAYQVDSFGHTAILPSIYAAAGCRFAVQCRPSQAEMPLPSRVFRWIGPDGAEILTVNLESYGLEFENTDPLFTVNARIKKAVKQVPEGFNDWLLLIGMGNHGGGLSEKLIHDLHESFNAPPPGFTLKFSTLSNFFSIVDGSRSLCPIVKGELQYAFRGCYTSVFPVKKAVREAEAIVGRAERWAAVAGMAGDFNMPSSATKDMWLDLIFNHFHDILPGSSIEKVCEEALDHLGRAKHTAREVENDAALSVFNRIDTSRHTGVPVLIFNPHGTRRTGFTELEWLLDYRPLSRGGRTKLVNGAAAIASDGTNQYVQFLPTDMKSSSEWRVRGVFKTDVPACGYRVYWLKHLPERHEPSGKARAYIANDGAAILDNGKLKITCRKGGKGLAIVGSGGKAWLNGESSIQVLEDRGDSWGMGIDRWDNLKGEFKISNMQITAGGPLKATLRLEYLFGKSRFLNDVSLFDGENAVRCEARLIWNEKASFCKMAFPFPVLNPILRCGGPFSAIERTTDEGEGPYQGWVGVIDEKKQGFGVAGGGGNGFDWFGGCLRLSVVRSVLFGSFHPPAPDEAIEEYMDMGTHTFDYVIAPAEDLPLEAEQINMPLHITLGYQHPGVGETESGALELIDRGASLGALKPAEDGRGWIGRVWDRAGEERRIAVKVMGALAGDIKLMANGITSFRLTIEGKKWVLRQEGLLEGLESKPGGDRQQQ